MQVNKEYQENYHENVSVVAINQYSRLKAAGVVT